MCKINDYSLNNAFLRRNTLYIGVSDGAKVLCEDFVSYDNWRNVVLYKGLGVVKGFLLLVHYEEENQIQLQECRDDGRIIGILDNGYICINEEQSMVLKNTKIL